MHKVRPDDILSSMQGGLSFLRKSQLPSGDFRTIRSSSIVLEKGKYRRSPFITTFVLHSLRAIQSLIETDELIGRGVEYLLSECEPPGVWRFFGRGSHIPPDLDDTCCALAALKEFQAFAIDFSYVSQHMLQFRNPSGVFYTWIDVPREDNDIDPVVNANVLFFYSLMDEDLQAVADYLISIVQGIALNETPFRSFYYMSLPALLYTISRAIAVRKVTPLGSLDTMGSYVRNLLSAVPESVSVLDAALTLSASLDLGMKDNSARARAVSVLRQQKPDGSWNAVPFIKEPASRPGVDIYYGSPELTTALCLEALAKFHSYT